MRHLNKPIFKRFKYSGGCPDGGYLSFDLIDSLFPPMKLFPLIVYNTTLLNLNVEPSRPFTLLQQKKTRKIEKKLKNEKKSQSSYNSRSLMLYKKFLRPSVILRSVRKSFLPTKTVPGRNILIRVGDLIIM